MVVGRFGMTSTLRTSISCAQSCKLFNYSVGVCPWIPRG